MFTCTSYDKTFLTCTDDEGERCRIEEYDQSNWSVKKPHKGLTSCNKDQKIFRIRFNSNGTYLGLILCENILSFDFGLNYVLQMI